MNKTNSETFEISLWALTAFKHFTLLVYFKRQAEAKPCGKIRYSSAKLAIQLQRNISSKCPVNFSIITGWARKDQLGLKWKLFEL